MRRRRQGISQREQLQEEAHELLAEAHHYHQAAVRNRELAGVVTRPRDVHECLTAADWYARVAKERYDRAQAIRARLNQQEGFL